MADRFESFRSGLESPASHAFAIAPHASNPLAEVTRAIWVGSAGNLVVRFVGSTSDVTLSNVPEGVWLPIRVSHVRTTSTAGSLVGMV